MKSFENKEVRDELRDANNTLIEALSIPSDEMLEELTVQIINESIMERVSLISNIIEKITEEDEGWTWSEAPNEVTKLTIEKIMVELTGESWFDYEKDEGYSIGEIIELLSKRAFVQLSELTIANIRTCLENGGKVIAYFPDLVWREYFNQLVVLPNEVLGMRAIEVEEILYNDGIIINDFSSVEGKRKQLDQTSFKWLSQNGWMLEVYK